MSLDDLDEPLPAFRYHPDPVGTGSVEASDAACAVCGRARGAIYVGPVYAEAELDRAPCPWCIASGEAHRVHGASFTDEVELVRAGVPKDVVDEVTQRTPGYTGWQQEEWLACCGDAAAYLGRFGWRELRAAPPAATVAVRRATGFEGERWQALLRALDADGSPTAYLFRCLHCHGYVARWDQD